MKMEEIFKLCERANNLTIFDSFVKARPKIQYKQNILCSISGGSDSDIMLDIISKLDVDKKVKYVFFDTGIEYEATKRHLDYLENKYGIKIEKRKAVVPVPLGCRKYGVPFWSKYVSDMIERLQRHNFKWEDKPIDELLAEYPKCKGGIRWWCNDYGEWSRFNSNFNRGMKEYMIAFPPTFKISAKCCKGAKKDNAKIALKEYKADLNLVGIRKSEGGIRGAAYKTCFDLAKDGESWDNYRPIFWYTNEDKEIYEAVFGVIHSDCYCVYGMKGTGCAGCPFGKRFEDELTIIKEHEPKLYNAVNKIFGASYEYTRNYLKFREALKDETQKDKGS